MFTKSDVCGGGADLCGPKGQLDQQAYIYIYIYT